VATLDSESSSEAKLAVARRAERLADAENLARHYVLAAAGLALVPVPLADLIGVMALQVKLVHGLAGHYGVPFKASLAQSLLASLLSGASATLVARALASLAKAVPGLGSLAGGGAAVSFASVTYAVGAVFIRHFESGGSLLDFDSQKTQPLFRQALLAGPAVAVTPAEAETPADDAPPAVQPTDPGRGEPAAPGGDWLQTIRGIGPVYAEKLKAAGITRYAELAALSPGQVRDAIGRNPVSGENLGAWIEQAAALAAAQAGLP
jgi:predicted flap endonuclease-1-like 5' DNA nuclease